MSRPSLAEVRRAQILDAAEDCLLEHGIEGVTFARIARRAGLQTSMVPHYFGTKGALMADMVDRVLARIERLLDGVTADLAGPARIERLLDVLFGGALTAPRVVLVVDQLHASAYFTERTRERLVEMYEHFERLADDALADAFPHAPAELRRSVAYSIVGLVRANNSFRAVGFAAGYDERARAGARVLVASLRPTSTDHVVP